MNTAYSYIRFSSKEQMHGDSERRQLKATEDYCEQHNLKLSPKSFNDFGISAFKDVVRPSLQEMKIAIDEGLIRENDYIILESFDRLSRKGFSETYSLINSIIDKGVNIVALHEQITITSVNRNNLENIIRIALSADLAFQESKKKSERISAAWQNKNKQAKADKKPRTKMIPSWIKLSEDGQKFELDRDKAKIIHQIFTLFSRGMGRRGIASKFNEEGIPHISTHTRTKGTWYPSFIQKIINNEAVVGTFTPTVLTADGKRKPDSMNKIEGYYPPAIEETLFNNVQAIIKSNQNKGGRKGKTMSNLLQGAVYCNDCGSTMQYINKNSKNLEFYLRCSKASVKACSNFRLYRYQLVERSILEIIALEGYKSMLSEQDKLANNDSQLDADISSRNQELRILNRKLDALLDATDSSSLKLRINSLSEKIKKTEDEIESLELHKKVQSNSDDEYIESLTYEDIVNGTAEIRIEFNKYVKTKLKLAFDSEGSVKVILLVPRHHKFNKNIRLTEIIVNGCESYARLGGGEDNMKEDFIYVKYEQGKTIVEIDSF